MSPKTPGQWDCRHAHCSVEKNYASRVVCPKCFRSVDPNQAVEFQQKPYQKLFAAVTSYNKAVAEGRSQPDIILVTRVQEIQGLLEQDDAMLDARDRSLRKNPSTQASSNSATASNLMPPLGKTPILTLEDKARRDPNYIRSITKPNFDALLNPVTSLNSSSKQGSSSQRELATSLVPSGRKPFSENLLFWQEWQNRRE